MRMINKTLQKKMHMLEFMISICGLLLKGTWNISYPENSQSLCYIEIHGSSKATVSFIIVTGNGYDSELVLKIEELVI